MKIIKPPTVKNIFIHHPIYNPFDLALEMTTKIIPWCPNYEAEPEQILKYAGRRECSEFIIDFGYVVELGVKIEEVKIGNYIFKGLIPIQALEYGVVCVTDDFKKHEPS